MYGTMYTHTMYTQYHVHTVQCTHSSIYTQYNVHKLHSTMYTLVLTVKLFNIPIIPDTITNDLNQPVLVRSGLLF